MYVWMQLVNGNGLGTTYERIFCGRGESMNFEEAVMQCFNNKQFISEYDRINGTNLSKRLSPIENMIDEATKMRDIELMGLISFVDEFIWCPVVADSRNVQSADDHHRATSRNYLNGVQIDE